MAILKQPRQNHSKKILTCQKRIPLEIRGKMTD